MKVSLKMFCIHSIIFGIQTLNFLHYLMTVTVTQMYCENIFEYNFEFSPDYTGFKNQKGKIVVP